MLQKQSTYILSLFLLFIPTLKAQDLYLDYSIIDSSTTKEIKEKLKVKKFKNLNSLVEHTEKTIIQLQKVGYLEANKKEISKKNDSTFSCPIYIGSKTNVTKINIGQKKWPNEILKEIGTSKSNAIELSFEQLESKLEQIKETWKNHGYSFSEVQLLNIRKSNDTLFADISIYKNDLRKIDSLTIKGYDNFPKKILLHKYGLKPNKKLNQDKIKKASIDMEAMGIAKETKAPEILFEKNKSTVFLYLEKINNNYFDGIIGFASNEETGKLEFNGNIDLTLHNNLNQGEKLSLNYRADGNSQQELKINANAPYFANTPITPSGGIHIYKKDSTYTNTNLNIKLNYDIGNWSYYAGFEQHKSTNLLQEVNHTNNITSLNGHFYITGINHLIYQNDILNPIKSYLDIQIGIGKRDTDMQSELQYKSEIEAYKNFIIIKNHSLFSKINYMKLWSKDYYSNELFRIGGTDNIRGFNENSIDASSTYSIQTEYRYKLSQEIYIHTITDLGRIENKAENIKENLIGLGFGIGIYNKLGLMKVQIANGSTSHEKIDFDKTRIHISIHTKF